MHLPPRTVALASSGRGCSQTTDVLLAASRTLRSPLPPEGPFSLGAGSAGPSMAGSGLSAKGSACQAGLCGESRGRGSAAVLASLSGRDQRGCAPELGQERQVCLRLAWRAPEHLPGQGLLPEQHSHPEQTPSGARAYVCFQLEGPVGRGRGAVLAHNRPEETAQNLVGRDCSEPSHECLERDVAMATWKQGTEQLSSRDTPGPSGLGASPPHLPPARAGMDRTARRRHASHGAQWGCDSSLRSPEVPAAPYN